MPLSVIGTGFGRTGTLSLKLALDTLGFGPCYHMTEVFSQPGHAEIWSRAADGDTVDWDDLFRGYQATVDWPACYFWLALSDDSPNSKIIHTVRESEGWYRSVRNTIYQAMTKVDGTEDSVVRQQRALARKIVLDLTFDGRFEDKAHAIKVFERHSKSVEQSIPPDRLLVYEVSQGWSPLCRFLGVPVPESPFPRVNTTEEFKTRHL